jgi:dTMP kinase
MFITVEGVDGSGKTSLIKGIADHLRSKQLEVVTTREPGGTPVAEELRRIVLSNHVEPLVELLIFTAARIDHCKNKIIPALLAGNCVVCDRFMASTYVYQQCEKGLSHDLIADMELKVVDLFRRSGLEYAPSVARLEIILDCPYEIASTRLAGRGDINVMDTLDSTVFNIRRVSYLKYAHLHRNAFVINASNTPEDTLNEALAAIDPILNEYYL